MDIIKIFKSKARMALLRLYFTNPDKEYYLRELERVLSTPVSIIRKELVALEKSGIFKLSKKANLCYYSLNKEYPLYDELKNIVFKTVGIQGALAGLLLSIKGIEVAFIYGSYAKNESNTKSDVDLFILGSIDEDSLLPEINKLEEILRRDINYSLYSRKDFIKKKNNKDSFIKDVVENKKIFLIGGENDI
ncbi:MAG: nucleotidyltransferase domain-containing protein [Candidatus Omnitrophica bacterium]|nr:nucleotidyltransferase domain-containing protein [Candidatus Omnitrophota bacterium]